MYWKFAVTSDGGKTWSTWDGNDYEELEHLADHGLIENVEIKENGKGKMMFHEIESGRNGISYLVTNDFGKTWQKP